MGKKIKVQSNDLFPQRTSSPPYRMVMRYCPGASGTHSTVSPEGPPFTSRGVTTPEGATSCTSRSAVPASDLSTDWKKMPVTNSQTRLNVKKLSFNTQYNDFLINILINVSFQLHIFGQRSTLLTLKDTGLSNSCNCFSVIHNHFGGIISCTVEG